MYDDLEWLRSGRGTPPRVVWAFAGDGAARDFDQSREAGESLLADDAGGLYLLDRVGKIVAMTRGLHDVTHVAWSDDGVGAVALGGRSLCLVDRKLKPTWEIDLVDDVLDVAITPYGNHLAASLGTGTTVIHDRTAKRVARIVSTRPLEHLQFVVAKPHLVGASNYGLVGRWSVEGRELWQQNLHSNTGDLSVTGDGKRVGVAAFNRGIQFYKQNGSAAGSLAIEGTPERVSLSYEPDRCAATTVEGDLFWMTLEGELKWGATLPEPVTAIVTAPLGDGVAVAFDTGRVVQLRW